MVSGKVAYRSIYPTRQVHRFICFYKRSSQCLACTFNGEKEVEKEVGKEVKKEVEKDEEKYYDK